MEQLKLGQLIGPEQQRDAVHIAVAPVTCGFPLRPGEYIRLKLGSSVEVIPSSAEKAIGIVDPFLLLPVDPGERFWMFLLPGTITSLRHEWVHPAFGPEEARQVDKSASEAWLRAYARKMNTYDEPQVAFDRLIGGLRTGKLFAYGTDLNGLYDLDDEHDLREHAEKYLGVRIDFDNFSFSCSC